MTRGAERTRRHRRADRADPALGPLQCPVLSQSHGACDRRDPDLCAAAPRLHGDREIVGPHQQLAAARRRGIEGRALADWRKSRPARCSSLPSTSRCGRPFTLLTLFDDPAYIFKRELIWIPIFGWYACEVAHGAGRPQGARRRDRRHGRARAWRNFARGRQVIIFPEGTRTAPGAPPAYKSGVAHLYAAAGVPCLPVALNSGVFWPRRKFLRRPGTIVLEVLDPIPPGLDRRGIRGAAGARDRDGAKEVGGGALGGKK